MCGIAGYFNTMDDLRRERARRDGENPLTPFLGGDGSPAFVGIVTTASTTTNKWLKVHPVTVTGTQTEGSTGTLTAQALFLPALYLGPGTVLAGQYVVVEHVGNRWVCDQMTGLSSNRIGVPGCICTVPTPLTMTVTNPANNFNIFQNCTISYVRYPPGAVDLTLFAASAFWSTAQFMDDTSTDLFWYALVCTSGQFCIRRYYEFSSLGSPFVDAIRYRWSPGFSGNTCTPWLMVNGTIFTGGDPSTVVTLAP